MQISFFEEFPTEQDLSKLSLLHFPVNLYLAAPDLPTFLAHQRQLEHHHNIKDIFYWPVLTDQEGYWLSPFSKRSGLQRIFHELQGKNIPLLWDAELPRSRLRYLTGIPFFVSNRFLLQRFLQNYQGKIVTAEYSVEGTLARRFFQFLGIHFPPQTNKRKLAKMLYSSLHSSRTRSWMERHLHHGQEQYGKRFVVGLGLLAVGVGRHDRVISPEQLERDLELCQEAGVHEVILFRLGGLNKEYLKVISSFLK